MNRINCKKMKGIKSLLMFLFCVWAVLPSFARQKEKRDYVILASSLVKNDAEWMNVVDVLQKKHGAEVLFYEKSPVEKQAELKSLYPRYVAVVEKPEQLGREFVMEFHRMSRDMDEDIYEDFLWGIITGYDAAGALKMVNNSTEPLVIRDAVSSITELKSAKWFDHYGWVDDHKRRVCGEKDGKEAPVVEGSVEVSAIHTFSDLYAKYDPDLVVTAFHATEGNLVMPFYEGRFTCRDGKLIANSSSDNAAPWELKESGKRRVYCAVGNCLIGNVNNTRESMAIVWMNSANAATMIGYVVTTWHGRAGWGALKYWLTYAGEYTLAEAVFINQQDFLHQQYEWYPSLYCENYPFEAKYREIQEAEKRLQEVLGRKPSLDETGFWHDRDVLAYYGDPKWNVRLQDIPEENDFAVTSKVKGKKCVVTIKTGENFNLQRMKGDNWKAEHVLDLPFSYFFPERLKNPRLAVGQDWKVALDENFLLVYNCDFEPNETYQVILDIDK